MSEYNVRILDLPQSERPRERFMEGGASRVNSAELIALILRTGSGGENVVSLANRLLAHFGGLEGIARASLAELQTVKGIGPAKAIELKAAIELGRRVTTLTPEEKPQIKSPADAANLLMAEMAFLDQEHLVTLLLNTKNRVVKKQTVYVGSLNSSVVRVGELFKTAIRESAASLIVAHNHPSGDPTPSAEDVRVTRELVKAGKLLNIEVLDHLVIGRNRFASLKERKLGFND